MKYRALPVYVLAVVLIFSAAIYPQTSNQTITPEVVASMKLVTEVALSPDGHWIAYTLRSPRDEGEAPGGYRYQLWLVDKDGKNARPFTAKEYNAQSIYWFKNGKRIAFLSRRGDQQQVYAIPWDGGEAVPLTSEKDGVASFKFSPDEKLIAFTRADAETLHEKENTKKGKDWQIIGGNLKYTRLYLYDLGTGQTRLLTQDHLHITTFDWSPDGQELIFTACKTPLTDATYMYQNIYRIPATGGSARIAVETEGKLGEAAFAPNGQMIAWRGALHIHDPQAQSLFVAAKDGSNKRNLTSDYEGSVDWFRWQDDQTIALVSTEKTATHLYQVDIRTGQKRHIRASRPIFTALSFDQSKNSYAFAGSTPVHPAEVFYVAGGSDKAQRLTNSQPVLDSLPLADQSTVEYKAQDGLLITGVVMKPVGFADGRRYPLIVNVHGGPEAAVLDGWNTNYSSWGQLLAANGYVVFWPNYRGSIGRGVAYSMKDQKDLGGQEFLDVLAGIGYLADELKLVDKTRVGMGGGSYGGYFSALAATRYTRHFKAAINFAGITNWISFLGTSDIPMENTLVHWGFTGPYHHLDKMWDASPMKYINNSQTAMLIAHGERDARVPIGQAWEMYTALSILKKTPHEFVIYPREGHGLVEREHQIDYMKRVLEWYGRYVK
jgi:dipeptidyl aminopeptidase/acylaminoacyl peptidase